MLIPNIKRVRRTSCVYPSFCPTYPIKCRFTYQVVESYGGKVDPRRSHSYNPFLSRTCESGL